MLTYPNKTHPAGISIYRLKGRDQVGGKGDSGDLRFGAWQSKICRGRGSATASCTIQELIGVASFYVLLSFSVS